MPARPSYPGAQGFLPDTAALPASATLLALHDAAQGCRGCDLYENATQTVFGRGPDSARLMLVGEQPGDAEDTEGRPFVGPAGRLLARAIDDAGLADVPTYVTNAVKHFRWKGARGGTRRIHEKPSAGQVTACRPWLRAELAAVRPDVLLALGATAAGSLFGPAFRLTPNRGVPVSWPPEKGTFAGDSTPLTALVTVHPSSILRAPDDERAQAYDGLVRDLRVAAEHLH